MAALMGVALLSGINFEMRGAEQPSYWTFSGLRSALSSMVPSSFGIPDWAMNFVSKLGENKLKAVLGAIIAYIGITSVKRFLRDYEQKERNEALRRQQKEEADIYYSMNPMPIPALEQKIEALEKMRSEQVEKMSQPEYQEELKQAQQRVQEYKEKLLREEAERKERQKNRQQTKSTGVLGSLSKTYETYGQHKARLAQEKEELGSPLSYAKELPENQGEAEKTMDERIQAIEANYKKMQ